MVCKNCGMELEEGAAFCQNCGTKVETEPAPEEFTATAEPVAEEFAYDAPPVPVKKKKSKAPIIILIVVLVLLLLVVPIAILLLIVILGGGVAALLAVFGMARTETPNIVDTPNSGYFSDYEEDEPNFEFEYDTDEDDGGSVGIIGGAVEDNGDIATTFSDPDNTFYTDGEITINPTYVYWNLDGSLVVEANVVNGKSFTVGDIDLDELSVYNGEGELIANGYFGRLEDLTLDSHYYEEWTFTFSPEYTNPGTDLSGLYCVAEFYYDF